MTAKEKYDDFKKFLYELEQSVRAERPRTPDGEPFKLTHIFVKHNPANTQIHKAILNRIVHYGSSEAELKDLVEEIKTSHVGAALEKRDRESLLNLKIDSNLNKYHSAEVVMHNYMRYYYNKYFVVRDGKLVHTGLDTYDYLSQNESEKKNLYVAEYLPIILLSNGECYFSPLHHQELAGWLTAQGKSIVGAVRMMINHKNYSIDISDIGKYEYNDERTPSTGFVLTPEQARAINIIYDDAASEWAKITPVNQMVMLSDIFGSGAVSNLKKQEKKNLMELEEAFGGKFSISEYLQGLRRQISNYQWD